MNINDYVGAQIMRLRKERGMNQNELAALIGKTRTSVTNIESGRQPVSLKLLYQIGRAFDIDPRDFLPSPEDLEQYGQQFQDVIKAVCDLAPEDAAIVMQTIRKIMREHQD